MFTGLIEAKGTLARLERKGPGVTLSLRAPQWMVSELSLGESVAVDGACLTVTRFGGDLFTVDASAETMDRTTLGLRKVGDGVHLERALRLGDRLGGHWVSGHVDATGSLRSMKPLGEARELWFDAPDQVLRYVVEKGSIAIDGASLTVNRLDQTGFSVVLIPHSQGLLHLSERSLGTQVNLEADLIGKYVERLLSSYAQTGLKDHPQASQAPNQHGSIDLSMLVKTGFLR